MERTKLLLTVDNNIGMDRKSFKRLNQVELKMARKGRMQEETMTSGLLNLIYILIR